MKAKHLLLSLLVLLGSKTLNASVNVNGIYYNLNASDHTAAVTSGSNKYTGSVTIPASVISNNVTYSVTSIGSAAFYNCSELTSISIPNSVTSIGSGAFYYCSSLSSITIPNSVTSIGEDAFRNTLWYNNQPDGLVYLDHVAYKYKGTMPSNTSITLQNGTTVIADQAFSYCSGLTSISIPNSVTSIGINAFQSCSGLSSIVIPNSVTNIDPCAFQNCGLTSIKLPNSITSIGHHTFNLCANLTCIVIPTSVTSIGTGAFARCTSLTSITIPNSVTSIESEAFNGCTSLASATIGNGVTSIGDLAFYCSNLTSVSILKTTPISITGNTFSNRANATLHVVSDSKTAYEAADYWKEFDEIIEGFNVALVDGQNYCNTIEMEMDEITYSRTFKNTYWQAWYAPFDLTLTDDVLAHFAFAKFAGTYSTEGGSFFISVERLGKDDVVKANTPYVVQAKVADSSAPQVITQNNATLKTAEENSFYLLTAEKKITFWGNYTRRTVTAEDQNVYALGGGKYSKQTTGNSLAPFRCFFTIEDREDNPYATSPNPTEVKLMVLGEGETAIEELSMDDDSQKVTEVYDLSGRKINSQQMRKGLYIINGKKVLVK